MLILKAPAKLNLVLEVLGKRRDGYHEIRSIIQTVDLCDVLTFDHYDGFSLDCTDKSLETPDNLALKAAHYLRLATGHEGGASIAIEKRVPAGAGMGGGSSDAAATLIGLNRLWGLGMSQSRLVEAAARLGSDVPFLVSGGTALVEGRGERVTGLPAPQPAPWYVLAAPPVVPPPDKTRRLYARLKPEHQSDGGRCAAMAHLLRQGLPISDPALFNVFERVAFEAFPGLTEFWRLVEQTAGRAVHLCGSGPAMFLLAISEAEARGLAQSLRQNGLESYAVSGVPGYSDAACGDAAGGPATR